jgi:hypothetical protein
VYGLFDRDRSVRDTELQGFGALFYPSEKLAKGHLLSHKQDNLAILLAGFAQQTAKLAQKSRIFA